MSSKNTPRRRSGGLLLVILFDVLLVGAMLLANISLEEILASLDDNYWLAAIVIFLVLCVKTILPIIPLVVIYVAAGVLLPTPVAIIVVTLGLAVESTLGYLIGKRFGMNYVKRLVGRSKRAEMLMRRQEDNAFSFAVIVRILPGPPSDVTSMFFGATGMHYMTFLASSLLGFSARMVPLIIVGEAAKDPFSPYFVISAAFVILVAAITLVIHRKVTKKESSESEVNKDDSSQGE